MINGVGEVTTTLVEVIPTLDDGTESPAAAAGLEAGDKLVAINGTPTPDWTAVGEELSTRPGEEIVLTVERDGELIELTPTLASWKTPRRAGSEGSSAWRRR